MIIAGRVNYSQAKHHLDPIKLIKIHWPDFNIDHIEYCPKMKPSEKQYYISAGSTHDGTVMFTNELLFKCVLRLMNMMTHYIPTEPKDFEEVKEIHYKIGPIRIATVFGNFEINGHTMPGQRDRVRIPVICEYIMKSEKI